ncbi:MAG: DUF3825 domain-containing protein, partial [Smithella sp.]
AEKENWYYDAPQMTDAQKELGVLFQYVHHTFARLQKENKILIADTHAVFNTGLLTPNGEEIFGLFEKNKLPYIKQEWYLESFYIESSRYIPEKLVGSLPDCADYFSECPGDLYFDPRLKITTNMDHILNDNFERLPKMWQAFPAKALPVLLNSASTVMIKRIIRNNRIVVPQYYKGRIMYLAPLQIGDDIAPLAIEKFSDSYRINTVFSPGMAYCNARLLMKPESNWLTNTQG